jgi:hypothetical protein
MNDLVSSETDLRDLISLSTLEQIEYQQYLDELRLTYPLPTPEYYSELNSEAVCVNTDGDIATNGKT